MLQDLFRKLFNLWALELKKVSKLRLGNATNILYILSSSPYFKLCLNHILIDTVLMILSETHYNKSSRSIYYEIHTKAISWGEEIILAAHLAFTPCRKQIKTVIGFSQPSVRLDHIRRN